MNRMASNAKLIVRRRTSRLSHSPEAFPGRAPGLRGFPQEIFQRTFWPTPLCRRLAGHPDADEQSRYPGLPAALLARDHSRYQRGFQKPGAWGPSKWYAAVTCGVIECSNHRHERRGKELLRATYTHPSLLYSLRRLSNALSLTMLCMMGLAHILTRPPPAPRTAHVASLPAASVPLPDPVGAER